MKMNNEREKNNRIGPDLNKNDNLDFTKELEAYILAQMKNYPTSIDYDVIADELPYFKTFNYTEYAHTVTMHPLQLELRVLQMEEAYDDDAPEDVDYVSFFRDRIVNNDPNKYKDRKSVDQYEPREAIVVLPGSNKLKECVCLNKMKYIRDIHGKNVWFKPHPMTQHKLVGEIMDLMGEERVLPRGVNLYQLLKSDKTKMVYSSMLSESAMYAVALDKQLEPIDVYNKMPRASFYHINKYLFFKKDPKRWINRTFNSAKSGIFCPLADENWRKKVDDYLEYAHNVRNRYKNKFI